MSFTLHRLLSSLEMWKQDIFPLGCSETALEAGPWPRWPPQAPSNEAFLQVCQEGICELPERGTQPSASVAFVQWLDPWDFGIPEPAG